SNGELLGHRLSDESFFLILWSPQDLDLVRGRELLDLFDSCNQEPSLLSCGSDYVVELCLPQRHFGMLGEESQACLFSTPLRGEIGVVFIKLLENIAAD